MVTWHKRIDAICDTQSFAAKDRINTAIPFLWHKVRVSLYCCNAHCPLYGYFTVMFISV